MGKMALMEIDNTDVKSIIKPSSVKKSKSKKRVSFGTENDSKTDGKPDKPKFMKTDKIKSKKEKNKKSTKPKDGTNVTSKKRKLGDNEVQSPTKKIRTEVPSDPNEKVDWNEYKKKKKELKSKRKQGNVDGAQTYIMSVKAKAIWEELRASKCSEYQKQQLSKELMDLIKGNVKKIMFAHDTVRVVECLMATSGVEIKARLFSELKDDILPIAKSKYSHFFIQKILRYGDATQKTHVFKQLCGNVVPLMKHKVAAESVELFYNDVANKSQRAQMTMEFYGAEFALFKEETYSSVTQLLEKHPEKRKDVLVCYKANLQALVDKQNLSMSIVHFLLQDFLTQCNEKDREDILSSIREHAIGILHTRDGSRVARQALWYGSPKERKKMVKSFKTHVCKIACEEYGHLALLAAFDCVDDTNIMSKAIIGELVTGLDKLVENEYGRKVIVYLLSPRNPTYFHPQIIDILKQGDGNPYSKKVSSVRTEELRSALSPHILAHVADNLKSWLHDNAKCLLATTTIKYSTVSESHGLAVDAVVALTKLPLVAASEDETHVTESVGGNMLLKKLIKHDITLHEEDKQVLLSRKLVDSLDADQLKTWLTVNRSTFVLLYLVESSISEVSTLAKQKLRPLRKLLLKQEHKAAEILTTKIT